MSTVTLTDRLLLMTQLAFAFAVLHKQGWVVGNFSWTNAAFALGPPRLMLFDCDDAASLSDQDRCQPHTPNWYPPECEGPTNAPRSPRWAVCMFCQQVTAIAGPMWSSR